MALLLALCFLLAIIGCSIHTASAQTSSAAPLPVQGPAFARTSTRFYIQGGSYGQGSYGQFFSLDLAVPWNATTPAWTQLQDGPKQSVFPAAFSADQKTMIIFHSGSTTFAFRYSIATGQWSPSTIRALHDLQGVQSVTDPNTGLVYLPAGYAGNNRDSMDIYNFDVDTLVPTPLSAQGLATWPSRAYYTSVWCQMRKSILLFGGYNTTLQPVLDKNNVTEFVPASGSGAGSGSWQTLATTGTPPSMRADHCMTTNDDGSLMIIYGGRPSNGGAFSGEVFILDTNTLAWRSGVPGPPRVYTTCTVAGDQLLVWGGMSADAAYAPVQVFIYSITSNTWITQYTPPKSYVDIRATESPPAPGPQPTGSGSNGGTVTNPGGTTATDSKSNAGAIAGGVVGGVAAICCIILFFVFRRRRQHRPLPLKNTSDQDEPKPSSPPPPPPPPLSERDEELLRMRTQLQNQQEQLDLQRRLLHLQQQQQQLNIIQQPQPQPVQYQYQDPAYGYQPPIIYSNAPPTSGSPLHSNYSNPITSGVHSSPETLHVNHGLVTSIGSPGVPPPPHTGYADCAGQYVEAHAMTPLTYAHPTAVALPPKSAGAKNDGAYWEDRPPGNPHAVIEAS